MNKFLSRIPLPVKLLLIGLIPLICILYLAAEIHREKINSINRIDHFINQMNEAEIIAGLKDNLQEERRYSFGALLNKDMNTQKLVSRDKTDQSIIDVREIGGHELNGFEYYTNLQDLDSVRKEVDAAAMTPLQTLDFYSGLITRINSLAAFSSDNLRNFRELDDDIKSFRLLSQLITQLGITRSDYYYALNKNKPDSNGIERVRNSYSTFQALQKEFEAKSSDKYRRKFKRMLDSGKFRTINSTLRQYVGNRTLNSALSDDEWWDISASGVDEIITLKNQLFNEIQAKAAVIYEEEKQSKNYNLIFMISIIVVVLLLVMITVRNITLSINQLQALSARIAIGAPTVEKVNYPARDAIHQLARSIYSIDENATKLSRAAVEIGKGNFDVPIEPRSTEDNLGNAILQMRSDLQFFNAENANKMWYQNGLSEINQSVLGEKNVHELTRHVLEALHRFFENELSVFYVLGKSQMLHFTSSYGVTEPKKVPQNVELGSTQLGEAALAGKVRQIKDLPQEYLKMSSALGEVVPTNLIFIPLYYNNHLEGIIEMASIDAFNEDELKLLQEMAITIAIALQAAKSRETLQELLEETQAQSEELQTQQSELESMNAELEAQALNLQASEEELKVQQEELQQTNQELEHRTELLQEKNEEILRKAEELALSTKYKSEFLANMSHELRTPLNSILLLSRLLSDDHAKNLTPEQVEYATVIQSSGTGLLHLIDEILDLSKIEAGKMQLEYENVHISSILEEMRALFFVQANEKGIEFIVEDHSPTDFTIETDRLRLGQIIKNLISNAIKFTSEGNVTLISGACENNPRFYCFTIRDTGIGISEDKQRVIFEAFQQADGSTKRKFGGTGLGLSISRELVKLLGGEIVLTSEPDKGSEFRVYVPIEQSGNGTSPLLIGREEEASEEQAAPEVVVSKAKDELYSRYLSENIPNHVADDRKNVADKDNTILIVEDDVNFAKSLLEYTRRRGYKGIVCVRGDEAESLARLFKPKGILLDIELPVMNGWEVMDRLKKNPDTRHIPVHIMSSHQMRREGLRKGAIDFIEKPVAFEQMGSVFEKIEYVLQKNPKKVLIIEDNHQHAQALAFFLQNFDVNANVKGSLEDSMDALKTDELDCVVLDMGIPDTKAYEVLEEARRNKDFETLPIIVFTGKSLSDAEEKRIRRYADSIVVKTAHSYQRMLDEVSLFLHLVEDKQTKALPPAQKKNSFREILEKRTVLIADDDVRNIFSLSKALESYNMNVISATDGKEALECLKENDKIDIVLLDMMMPEMDGYETARAIRSQGEYRDLPIIAVTAKAMTGDREKCIEAGASDYITKPVDIDQLLSLLRVWLYNKN